MKVRMIRPRIRTLGCNPKITNLQERPNARGRGYSAEWDRAAAEFKRQHPFCLGCAAVGIRTLTEVVDHVEPHKGDRHKFWNRAMWQPSCRWHHDAIKARLESMFLCGAIGLADLWLNSSRAISMTRDSGRG